MDLYKAVGNNNLEEVRKLLQDENVNVNFQNENYYNRTPFHESCYCGYTDIVQLLLLHKKINVNLVDSDGYTPFSFTCYFGQTETVKVLLQDIRVNVNLVNNRSWTPLTWSCWNGNTQTVKELIKCGRIDLFVKTTKDRTWDNITYKSGSSALDIARQRGKKDIVEILEQEMNKRKKGTNKCLFYFIIIIVNIKKKKK
jgi:ankyrin repeat protein